MRHEVLAVLLLATLGAGCSSTPRIDPVYQPDQVFDSQARRVVLVSFDGLRPDTITTERTPHLASVKAAGAYAEVAQAVIPSITLVNHASMIAGVGPAKHRIDWNDWIPEKGMLGVPTVFDLAKQKGLTTAMVAGKSKFNHLNRPGTIDHFTIESGTPYQVAKKAMQVLRDNQPDLLMVHFRHADSEGHENGWMSESQLSVIADEDQAFGHILNTLKDLGLLQSTAVLVTADHGGSDHNHGGESELEVRIPWFAVGAEIPVRGAVMNPVSTIDTAATAAGLLDLDVPAEWDGVSVFSPAHAAASRSVARAK